MLPMYRRCESLRTGYYGHEIPSRNLSERSEKMRCEPIENGRAPPNPESGVIGGSYAERS